MIAVLAETKWPGDANKVAFWNYWEHNVESLAATLPG
jgi:hypothetical protein